MHPGELAGGFSDLEMTWLLYCAGTDTAPTFFSLVVGDTPYCELRPLHVGDPRGSEDNMQILHRSADQG